MYNELNRDRIRDRVFFLTILVFYSLNMRFLQLPNSDIWRWVALLLLTIVTVTQGYQIYFPPFLAVYSIAIIPSIFVSVDVNTSIIKAVSFLFSIIGVSTYFMSLNSRNEMDRSFCIVLKAIMIFGIANIVGMLSGSAYDSGRAIGLSTNANSLGIYANMCLIACIYYRDKVSGIKKIFIFVIMILSAILVIMSGSRSCFASLVVNLLVMLWGEKRSNRVFIIGAIAIIAVVMIARDSQFHIRALDQLLTPEGRTRGILWEMGISVWKAHPYFGCGYMTSEQLNTTDLSVGRYAFHNSYISILAEIGLWGVSIIGVYFLKKALSFFRQIRLENNRERFSPFFLACLIMINMLVTAYGESFLFSIGSTEAFIFWSLFMWSTIYLFKNRYETE